jgi:hypothetical protein
MQPNRARAAATIGDKIVLDLFSWPDAVSVIQQE